jgi:parallel beta-helix repeat protein
MRTLTGSSLAFALMLCGLPAQAANYLVSNSGSDGASGLSGAPWQTLQHAIVSVQAGDTVTAEDGTYAGFLCDGVSGTANAPIVLRARTKWGAKITTAGVGANSQDFVQLNSCSYVTVDGFEVSGAPRSGIAILGNTDTGDDARGVIIQNCHSHHNGANVTAGRHDGIFSGFALDLTVQDNEVHDNSEHGIYVSNAADNPIIRRNHVYAVLANCIQINADLSTGGDGTISNWLIENNVAHECHGAAAINLDGVVSGILRNNLIYNCDKGGITLFQGDGAVASSDNVVVSNTIYCPSGSRAGLQVADGANNNVVFNNILYAAGGGGLEIQSVTGLVHDYNLVSSYVGGSASANESAPAANTIFTNSGAWDLTLLAGSPAVDKGVALLSGKDAPTTDLIGASRPAGGGYDIGCYERGGTPAAEGGAGGAGGTAGGTGGAAGGGTGGARQTDGGTGGTASGGTRDGGAGGSAGSSASTPATAGGADAGDSGGCGCRSSAASPSGALIALVGVLCAVARRKRGCRLQRN